VVYGALLDATGLVGPAEVASKRRYTFRDVVRTARLLGVPMAGPPAHPFRSLEALRTICLFQDEAERLSLAVALAHTCWGKGADLTQVEVLERVVADVGLEADSLEERIAAPAIKNSLRSSTQAALEAGVFGVPTFRRGRELFWGHDRLEHLAASLDGRLTTSTDQAASMEERPRGTDRGSSPMRSE